jgi:tricorn protease
MLRFPTHNGENIRVSPMRAQLYTVPIAGGTARRLTDGPGYAIFPRFSADGSQLAFTAQYDGNTEVYVMPPDGGTPAPVLTTSATLGRDDLADRMGPNNIVLAWRKHRPRDRLPLPLALVQIPSSANFTPSASTATCPAQLPVPRGGFVTFSPDDKKIAYNRVFREFRTWKRYQGGMADDVWIFDLASGAIENITNHPRRIFSRCGRPTAGSTSSRSARHAETSSPTTSPRPQTRQLTSFTDIDVKFPSLGRGAVVFEQAGQIWRLDLATERSAPVPIRVQEDFAAARPVRTSVARWIQGVSLAPDAQRVVVVARGEVFSVPAKQGATRNLTQTPGVHERGATWSPDGKWIAYLSPTPPASSSCTYVPRTVAPSRSR